MIGREDAGRPDAYQTCQQDQDERSGSCGSSLVHFPSSPFRGRRSIPTSDDYLNGDSSAFYSWSRTGLSLTAPAREGAAIAPSREPGRPRSRHGSIRRSGASCAAPENAPPRAAWVATETLCNTLPRARFGLMFPKARCEGRSTPTSPTTITSAIIKGKGRRRTRASS